MSRAETSNNERSFGFNTTTTTSNDRVLSIIRSKEGILACFIKGLFINKKANFTNNSNFSLEIKLFPEETKSFCSSTQAQKISNSQDFDGSLTWDGGMSFPITWALLQRKVSMLSFSIYMEENSKRNDGTKRFIGSYDIDLVSLFSLENVPFILVVPIQNAVSTKSQLNPSSPNGTMNNISFQQTSSSFQKDFGDFSLMLLVGLSFNLSKQSVSESLTTLSDRLTKHWNNLTLAPIYSTLGINMCYKNNLPFNKLPNSSIITLHLALADVQLTSPDIRNLDTTIENTEYYCLIRVVNTPSLVIENKGTSLTQGKVKWLNEDVVIQIETLEEYSLILEFSLLKYDVASATISSHIGVCNLTLPNSCLRKGVPMNYQLPLRDQLGFRTALLTISIQSTSISTEKTELNQELSIKSSEPIRSFMLIEFLEGNITNKPDGTLVKDIFFESSLYIDEDKKKKHPGIDNFFSRTGYLTTAAIDNWALTSRLSLPSSLVELFHNNNDMSMCSLLIRCKESSSIECFEIGFARISLPLGLIKEPGKIYDQWVTFYRANPNPTIIDQSNNSNFSGRVKVRMSFVQEMEIDFPSLECGVGLGMISNLFIGVSNSRLGNDSYSERLLTAQLSSHFMPLVDEFQNYEIDSSNLVDNRNAQTIKYIQEFELFNRGELGCNIIVPSGSTEVKFDIRTETGISTYTTNFPVMKSIPKPGNQDDQILMPIIDLPLIKSQSKQRTSFSPSKEVQTQGRTMPQIDPKLRIQTCFVPYLEGILLIDTISLSIDKLELNKSSQASVKYSFGYPSPQFTYSSSVYQPSKPQPVNPKMSRAQSINNNNKNKNINKGDSISFQLCSLKVNTYECLQQELPKSFSRDANIRDKEYRTLLPLAIEVTEDNLAPSLDSIADKFLGILPTAPIYMNSVRKLASDGLLVTDSQEELHKNYDNVKNDKRFNWKVFQIDLFHNKTRQIAGTLQVRLAFAITTIPKFVSQPLERLFNATSNDPQESARIELGLKQAFMLADSDNSGFVSATELLTVIKDADFNKCRNKTMTETTLGFSNASKLLMTLAGKNASETLNSDGFKPLMTSSLAETMSELEILVQNIFSKLDVDGDGLISWWEWKSVLTATLASRNPKSNISSTLSSKIDPLDPLTISLYSVYSVLSSYGVINEKIISNNRFSEELSFQLSNYLINRSASLNNQQILQYPLMGSEIIENESQGPSSVWLGSLLGNEEGNLKSRSKLKTKLHYLISSLRLTNNLLAQRLEKALLQSQSALTLNPSTPNLVSSIPGSTFASTSGLNPDAILVNNQEFEDQLALLKHQSKEYLDAYEELNIQQQDIHQEIKQLQLIKQQKLNNFQLKQQQINQKNKLLKDEIKKRLLSIKAMEAFKQKKSKATFTIHQFIQKYYIPYREKCKFTKASKIITNSIRRYCFNAKFNKRVQIRVHRHIQLQSWMRMCLTKRRLRKFIPAVIRLQCLVRKYRAKKFMSQRRIQRENYLHFMRNKLALKILLLWHNFKAKRINEASKIITKHVRHYSNKKKQDRLKRDQEKYLMLQNIKNKSAKVIQWFYRARYY